MVLPYPLVEFVLSVGTWETAGEAYPDTGFEGGIAIPLGAAREILAEPDRIQLRTADGSLHQVRVWTGVAVLDDHRFQVDVVALGHRYLLGREILDRLEICFQYGRSVRLRFGDEDTDKER